MYRGSTQIVLIPDVQLNGDIWLPQKAAFPKAKIPSWIPISPNDNVGDYARRCAQAWLNSENLDWQRPMFLAGFEIGGPIAIEAADWLLAQGIPVAGVLLIGSYRDTKSLLRTSRWRGKLIGILGDQALRNGLAQRLTKSLTSEGIETELIEKLVANLQSASTSLFRWSRQAALRWRLKTGNMNSDFPIHQIHGRRDRFLRPPSIEHATILLQGQHYISLSQSEQVNRWIEAILRDFDLRRRNEA